jgi:hypothetical protein
VCELSTVYVTGAANAEPAASVAKAKAALSCLNDFIKGLQLEKEMPQAAFICP